MTARALGGGPSGPLLRKLRILQDLGITVWNAEKRHWLEGKQSCRSSSHQRFMSKYLRAASYAPRMVSGDVVHRHGLAVSSFRRVPTAALSPSILGFILTLIPVVDGGKPPPNRSRDPARVETRLEERGPEKWWTSPKRDAAEVAELMRGQGLDFLTRYQDPRTVFAQRSLLQRLKGNRRSLFDAHLTRSRRFLLFARVYEYIGRRDWANQVAESALAERLPVGPRVQLKRLLVRLQGADTTEG